MPLSSDIIDALAILNRRGESVSAVMGTGAHENRFTRALAALEILSLEHDLPIAIVGGLGAIRYGYPAVTEDIDVAICRTDLKRLISIAPNYGFQIAWEAASGWHTLTYGDVEINVVPEGGKAKHDSPTTIPGPVDLGVPQGLGYARLAGWMELKISSGRQKDRAHIVEVLKKCEPAVVMQVRNHLANVHEDYLRLFNQLADEADEESQQERERK